MWLEQFLHCAARHPHDVPRGLRRGMCADLSDLWMSEMRNLCVYFESSKSSKSMDRYIFQTRGGLILYVLDKLAALEATEEQNLTASGEKFVPWWNNEMVSLLMNLYQVRNISFLIKNMPVFLTFLFFL